MLITKARSGYGTVKAADESRGIIEFLPSITGNVDYQRDRIEPGAYKSFIAKVARGEAKMPKLIFSHQIDPPILLGKTLAMEEFMPGDSRLPASLQAKGFGALWVKGQFNLDTQVARDTYSNLKFGALDEFSIQFAVKDGFAESWAQDRSVRNLKQIDPVIEYGPVLMGANPETLLLALKGWTPLRSRQRELDALVTMHAKRAVERFRIATATARESMDDFRAERRARKQRQDEFETAMARCYQADPNGHADKAVYYQRAMRRGAVV